MGLSAMTRGSTEEKLEWIFSLYDINHRGIIGQKEMSLVTQSMYDLLSRQVHTQPKKSDIQAHAEHAFEVSYCFWSSLLLLFILNCKIVVNLLI